MPHAIAHGAASMTLDGHALLSFRISGMYSGQCVTRAQRAIVAVDGVEAADMSFHDETAAVRLRDGATSDVVMHEIIEAVHAVGMRAEQITV